ncbi:MAG: fructokinase [Humisphaera sp.]|nr:fructokinase [Humisphaera sp.]
MTASHFSSSPRAVRAIGLGEVLWDLLPTGKQLGGAPANFSFHAQQLGARSAVVSAVGRDAPGDEIFAQLGELGIDTQHVAVDDKHATGVVTVTLDSAGVPSYVIEPGAAWDFLPASPAWMDAARDADVVCFGSLAQRSPMSRETIRAFLRATPRDCLRIFDINLRQSFYDADVIRHSLQLANVLKINDQELPVVAKLLDYAGNEAIVVRRLIEDFSLRLIALTRGERGSTLVALEETNGHLGLPAKLVDTVGAGDAFTAAVAIGLLRGESLPRINHAANRLAAYVCSQAGATPAIPDALRASLWE